MTVREKEDAVMSALVDACLKRGLTIDVEDGYEAVLRESADKAAILAAMWSVDEEGLILRQNGKRVGTVVLVHSNEGWDVVHDHSDNMLVNEIMDEIRPLTDKLQDD